MSRALNAVVMLQIAAVASLSAQRVPPWQVRGDTSGAPSGCSAATGIAAIDAWFVAFQNADSSFIVRVTAVRRGFVFSTGKFTPSDAFVSAHTLPELLSYARTRARAREHIAVQEVTFNGWRGDGLEFGPIYFRRTADDLGNRALLGVGKGEYWCGQGISVLNTAPRPTGDPGPRR